jgi:heme oxygenase
MFKFTVVLSISFLSILSGYVLNPKRFAVKLQSISVDSSADVKSKSKKSFVQDEMRPYAMKLHTRDQAPREGQQKAQTPFTKWEVSRIDYLRFLVDSLFVYETFEEIVNEIEVLAPFRNTGLERSQALKEDLEWMIQFDSSLTIPECGESGIEYSKFLKDIVKESIPKFMCHYYNQYFAHTAGGIMIGKKMAEKLLNNHVLKFYQWDGDVKGLLDNVRCKLDDMASTWSDEEKMACLEETLACFQYGGSLMVYMKPPSGDKS